MGSDSLRVCSLTDLAISESVPEFLVDEDCEYLNIHLIAFFSWYITFFPHVKLMLDMMG